MPIVKIYGVPPATSTRQTRTLKVCCDSLRAGIADVEELHIVPEQVSVFFPADLLEDGLGEEIIVEVIGLFLKPERTPEIRQQIAVIVANRIKTVLGPYTKNLKMIEVLVYSFNQQVDGYNMVRVEQVV